MRWYSVSALSLLLFSPCFGKEAVYFKTGFSLEVDSHIQQDQMLVFRIGDGTLEFPVDEVLRIDAVADSASAKRETDVKIPARTPESVLGEAAFSQGLEPELVRSVAKVESGLRQDAVSPKGALGLMQLMPATAAELGINPKHAGDNAQGGAKYLRDLLIRYNGNSALALAAYNAGPGAVARFGGVPPYSETQQYVLKVIREYQRQKKANDTTHSSSALAISKPISTN